MYNLNEFEVLEIVDKAVAYGVRKAEGKNIQALAFAEMWLDGYIYGNEPRLTDDDIKSLKSTMNDYKFM